MELLNKLGIEILEYKTELLNPSHSDLVRRALNTATTTLLSNDVISIAVHDGLRDASMPYEAVKELVLALPDLRKTEAELKSEYDALLAPFHEQVAASHALNDPAFARLTSESHVPLEEVQFILSFEMTKDFIGKYFERTGEELDRMMRPEGFAEKFAILRYGALVSKFLKKQDHYDAATKRSQLEAGVEVGATKVYVNKDEDLYGVELVYHVPIAAVEDPAQQADVLTVLSHSLADANDFMTIRTIA